MAIPFSYHLPFEKIAQRPVYPPDAAKLLVVNRNDGVVTERRFHELDTLLSPNDLLILNNTKVNRARLFGSIAPNIPVEILVEEKLTNADEYRVFGRPMKKMQSGVEIIFSPSLTAQVIERIDDRGIRMKFFSNGETSRCIEEHGVMPIPPYIRDGKADHTDITDYQTLFAQKEGSIAAPTASLHFTETLFARLSRQGIDKSFVTLHVGVASIFPVSPDSPPAAERMEVPTETLEKIKQTQSIPARVVGVGTTVARAVESAVDNSFHVSQERTDLFITPGHSFKGISSLITNFHQPGTTHLLLVEAFLGRELLEKAYEFALSNNFRFLSYGDAMIIL